MTEEYRLKALANAREQVIAARRQLEIATNRTARRNADESLEFWTDKVSFLYAIGPQIR